MDYQSVTFLYLGPETILPLTSVLAAIVGVVLTFWRWFVAIFAKAFKLIRGREDLPIATGAVDLGGEDSTEARNGISPDAGKQT